MAVQVVQFDASAGNVQLEKTVGPSSKYTVEFDFGLDASTIAALFGFSADLFRALDPALSGQGEGFYLSDNSRTPLDYGCLSDFGSIPADYFGSVIANTWMPAQIVYTWTGGGTLWNADFVCAGGSFSEPSPVDLFVDDTVPLLFAIGAVRGAAHATPENYYFRNFSIKDAADVVLFASDFTDPTFADWDALFSHFGTAATMDDPFGPAPAPSGRRFYQGYPWRFIFTDLDSVVTTWAQGLLTQRQVVRSLGEPSQISAAVWPDDFRVNGIWTDGYPRVAQSIRMVHCFRREGGGPNGLPGDDAPWRIREAGILMSPEDEGDADVPLTHFVAWDPRKLLEARPAMNSSGELPGPLGLSWLATAGSEIAMQLLANTIASPYGGPVHIDAGALYGGTGFYTGTIETTAPLTMNVEQGMSVGEVWSQLEATGTLDIILTPIWDPINRPGYTHEVSVYNLAGVDRHSVVMAWDRLNRSVEKMSRMHDGTPGSFFNIVQYFAGQGGPPVPASGPLTNGASITDFGSWWSQQFFPSLTSTDPTAAAVLAVAAQALQLAKQGKRTITMAPITERAKIVLLDYDIGDRIQVYASRKLRVTADGPQRVLTIPIDIDDPGIERMTALLTTPDWAGS